MFVLGDRLRAGKPPGYATSHAPRPSCHLSLVPCAEREVSTGQNAVMLCGWGLKAGWLIPYKLTCID